MPLPEDDRRAIAARLATIAPGVADVVADDIDDDEELREVLVDVDGEVLALTSRRALFATGGCLQSFTYDVIEVRRRDEGLGIDAVVEDDRLVLHVARGTFVRLGVLAQGSPPSRATWLPERAPMPRPVEAAPSMPMPPEPFWTPPDLALPPPGWHPDPSGRHWWRWWDGGGWTDHVADGGAPYLDPLPPR